MKTWVGPPRLRKTGFLLPLRRPSPAPARLAWLGHIVATARRDFWSETPMTTPPKLTAGPGADSPTNSRYWRDPLFLIGVVVLVTIIDLVLCITIATSF
jgi:hypothetical protein